ncbi:hypothetical protein K466DRAFT_604105 [Polyporus arcularius HHB13444]|uniref:Uncharacterized protein n=1 Tax=Polyporus arcularius HHB13444 TaxID=1314778 RepID=A0A5C3NZX1_9APHY|nr:hypothetical protein K466DRAFT_604105 [Polyporus arcularius HHB13444]
MSGNVQQLPAPLDDLNKVPKFTASQLVRALLLVQAEDCQINADDFDPRVFLCVACMNKAISGQRCMSFAWPDPEASEEERLIANLRRIMFPHRPDPPPAATTSTAPARESNSEFATIAAAQDKQVTILAVYDDSSDEAIDYSSPRDEGEEVVLG